MISPQSADFSRFTQKYAPFQEAMNLQLMGISHNSSPIEIRERFIVPEPQMMATLQSLVARPGVHEALVLCTCNRVEILVAAEEDATEELRQHLCESSGMSLAELKEHVYECHGVEAARHLFRVASSIESMVVGEPQILGQLKQAYSTAKAAGVIGRQLDRLLNHSFAVAKRVRSETSIGSFSISVPSVAVDMVEKVFGSVSGRSVFLVGAGDMGEVAARHLLKRDAAAITVVNRTYEKAVDLAARLSGSVIRFEDLYDECHRADIVICSTAAPYAIFRREHAKLFLSRRKNRPMCFIDIAVPRDVDPGMEDLEGIFVFNIDDLRGMATVHASERRSEATAAEAIINREVEAFCGRHRSQEVAPAIVSLRHHFEVIRQHEIRRIHGVLASMTSEQRSAIERLTQGIVNKILHEPITALKTYARESRGPAAVSFLESMFNIEPDNQNPALDGEDFSDIDSEHLHMLEEVKTV